MKNLFIVVCLFVLAQSANAATPPERICLAAGDVDLNVSQMIESVSGTIGATRVRLSYYQNYIYGQVEGLDAELRITGWRITGTIGENQVNWRIAKNHISGFERCLY